ncbi:MAG: TonB-dependent receptor [Sulfuricurvum sp.]|uniref:TonB-dependent receptor plug domain-containing protein n=1 Tax=Sulfuricurvum sp. TaxID=2025608 RepID=UPI0026349905|nr:TonB-dependent receptor [Sulfuricurvum sp.]MDD5159389.1 TonB-dependent receptor [Sulfuricurvum sp.]
MKKHMLLLSLATASVLYGTEGVFELGKVDVTSTSDTSSSTTTIIDAQAMQDHERKTVVEALNLLPGATIQSFGARNEQMIMIRGFDVKHAPLFIDGIPIAVPYDGYVDFSRFTTFDLSEIEVSKGLASPLLGANTFAGAINLVTKKPTKEFEGEVGAGFFSGNGRTEYINLGTNQGSYYIQASGSKTQRDTYPLSDDFTPVRTINEDGGDRNNAYATDDKLNLKVGFTPNSTDEYAINYIRQNADKGVPPDEAMNLSGRGFWQWRYWDKQSLYFLSKTDFGNWYLKSRVFYDKFQNSLAIYTNNGLYNTFAYGGVGNPSWYDEYTKGASLESGVKLSSDNTLKMALHYKIDDHQEGGVNQVAVYEMKDTISSFGIEDTHTFSKTLKLTIGTSYDREEIDTAQNTQYGKPNTNYYNDGAGVSQNTTTGYTTSQEFAHGDTSSFNPMIKLEGQIDDSLSWYGGVSGKSRIPSIKDRYSFKFNTFVPNPALDVEKTINYEVGGTKSLGNASFSGALFYADVSDYIQSAYIPLWYKSGATYTQQQQLQNVGKVTQKGFELSTVYAPFESLSFEGSYTYLKMTNEVDESQKITDVPKEKFIATVAYTPIENLTWFNTYEYDSERYAATGTTGTAPNTKNLYSSTGCVSVWNTKATLRATKAVSFDLGINNVFDRNFYYSYGYPEAGRSVFGNIRYKF